MAEQQWKSVEELLRAMTEVVEFDTEEPPSVNSKGIFGNSPLKVASVWGDEEAVRLLVSSGARIDEKNENGYTALHHAAQQEHLEVVKALLELGASSRIQNDEGRTAYDVCYNSEIREVLRSAT